MGDIHELKPGTIGDGIDIRPDQVLEQAKGQFISVVVCGFNVDGSFDLRGSLGSRGTLWALQTAIMQLMAESGE